MEERPLIPGKPGKKLLVRYANENIYTSEPVSSSFLPYLPSPPAAPLVSGLKTPAASLVYVQKTPAVVRTPASAQTVGEGQTPVSGQQPYMAATTG